MGGNIPGEKFLGGNFPGGREGFPRGDFNGNSLEGSFPRTIFFI